MDVVTLENLARVIVTQSCGGGAGDVEEEIYAYGEVCGVEESGSVVVDQVADVVEIFVPARGADDHVLAGFHAGFDVGEDAGGGGEIDDGVDVVELFWSEGGAGCVFFGAGDLDVMLAPAATSATSDPVLPRPRRRRFMAAA